MVNFITMIKDNVLIPLFGNAWLDISLWILASIMIGLIGLIIYLSISQHIYKKKYKESTIKLNTLSEQNRYLNQDKKDLEKSIIFVREELAKEKEFSKTLTIRLEEQDEIYNDLSKTNDANLDKLVIMKQDIKNIEDYNSKLLEESENLINKIDEDKVTIKELSLRIKRLEAARKATRTIAAKKKKQLAEKCINISENNQEIVD